MRKVALYAAFAALLISVVIVPVLLMKRHTRQMVCRHEAGHALVAWLSPYATSISAEVHDTSGWVRHSGPVLPTAEYAFYQLMSKTCGMAAADMMGAHSDEDAIDDITKSVQVAYLLNATDPDFVDSLQPCLTDFSSDRWFKDTKAQREVISLIDAAICQCRRLLTAHETELVDLERALDRLEHMEHEDIAAVLGPRQVLPLNELLGLK